MDNRSELVSSLRYPQNQKLMFLISNELSQKDSPTIKLIDLNITNLPDEAIELLHSVERLSLQKNSLESLPVSFGKLTKLRYLDLNGNNLQEIPSVLLQCSSLEILDLASNSITQLPQEYSSIWCENLKVLSIKNNKISSLKDLYPIISQLKNLKILEIEGNNIPIDELESVEKLVPRSLHSPEEYWCIALQQYFDHTPTLDQRQQKKVRASKRMGFISTPGNISQSSEDDRHHLINSPQQDLELCNHSKYNDYFKRLSVLPEEGISTSEKRVGHEDILTGSRKLLFTFTECQQNIRKMSSLCSDKTVAVNIISLLYTVRSHIDNLVEVLDQSENNNQVRDNLLVKLCVAIIAVFKEITMLLRKNFKSIFEGNDICFIRMFYVTLLCSYTEMYNAWCLIAPENAELSKKKKLGYSQSSNSSHHFKHIPTRQRSNTVHRITSNVSTNTQQSILQPPQQFVTLTQQSAQSSGSSNLVQAVISGSPPQSSLDLKPNVTEISPSGIQTDSSHSPKGKSLQYPSPSSVHVNPNIACSLHTPSESIPPSNGCVDNNIDKQLYHILNTVIGMANVIYSQLTQVITRSAIAGKTKDLMDTCLQSMELSKTLKSRLSLITSSESETYQTTQEKFKTWEDINAFLKSIISILANTKTIMKDFPVLNEVRPNLASLAKITKDVTVILDLSTYKGASTSTSSTQHVSIQQSSINSQDTADYSNFPSNLITPLSTPSLMANYGINPFDQL